MIETDIEDYVRWFAKPSEENDWERWDAPWEWAGCYCLEGHLDRGETERLQPFAKAQDMRRQIAWEMVEQGLMTGYTADRVWARSCYARLSM